MRALRRTLDALYLGSGAVAAFFLTAILAVIVAQMVARWLGFSFPGAAAYAGYCMGAASFFGMAHALQHGSHIRVTLLLSRAGGWQRRLDTAGAAVSAVIAAYFCVYAFKATYWSWRLGDISQEMDKTAIWVPQLAMCAGLTLFTVALIDRLAQQWNTGT